MSLVLKARKRNDPVLRSPNAKLNKFEQEIFDIYSKALSSMPKDLDNAKVIAAIRGAIEAGNPKDGAIAFQWGDFVASLDKTVPKLAQQLAASANISAAALPKKIRVASSFTGQDPRAIAWAQQRAGARILGITQETQKAVAETIARSLKTQLNREQVIDNITQVVGLDTRQARALGNFYEKNLFRLLEDGETYEKAVRIVTKLSKEYRQRLLVQRATRIARTETLAAANAGRMLSWAEADSLGLLPVGSEKRWKTATDERTCPICGPLHNTTVGWEDSFPTGDVMPPNHPNCRCTAVIVPAEPTYEKSVEKRYYRFADGEKTWRNYDYRWRKIANEMKRRIGKCQRCGSKSDLTVDHKKRLKDGGAKYDRKNLRVLCRSCNGRLSRLGTKLRKSNDSWLLAKHAPGKHNQQNHAGSRGSGQQQTSFANLYDGTTSAENLRGKAVQPKEMNDLYANYQPTEKGKLAISEYQETEFFKINSDLRAGKEPSALALEMDKVFEEAPQLKGGPIREYYRTTESRVFAKAEKGQMFVDEGYTSTSIDMKQAVIFGEDSMYDAKVRIIDTGFRPKIWVDSITNKPGLSQQEIIFQRKTPFTYVGLDKNGFHVLVTGRNV